MPSRKRKAKKAPSMYPILHDTITALLEQSNPYLKFTFHPTDDDASATHKYNTNITGHFTCHNPHCPNPGWASKVIAVTIRMYPGNRYNARVYHQRCKTCQGVFRPKVDGETYAERIFYRLQKWCGVEVEKVDYRGARGKKPHQRGL
ncbi:zinc-binding domain-containing protein, partial [Aspergillus egyptiacus]